MADDQRELQVVEGSSTGRHDESREQEASALPIARLLANPRRVRRA